MIDSLSGCAPYALILANGEMQRTDPYLKHRALKAQLLIAADGGINHCAAMNLTPSSLIGDLDSASSEILTKYPNIKIIKLNRSKDQSDLEAAIDSVDLKYSHIKLFAALGGRIDHSLSNIYLLLKQPGRLYIETSDQILFGVSYDSCPITIRDYFDFDDLNNNSCYLTCFPLYGEVSNITVTVPEVTSFSVPKLNSDSVDQTFEIQGKTFTISCESGMFICILEKKLIPSISLSNIKNLNCCFDAKCSWSSCLKTLQHICQNAGIAHLSSSQEYLIGLNSHFPINAFESNFGQIVSLIPFFGPVEGVETENLKWKLGNIFNVLKKDFISLSNVCLSNSFTVSIKKGYLLCSINKTIDEELVYLIDTTSTGVIDTLSKQQLK